MHWGKEILKRFLYLFHCGYKREVFKNVFFFFFFFNIYTNPLFPFSLNLNYQENSRSKPKPLYLKVQIPLSLFSVLEVPVPSVAEIPLCDRSLTGRRSVAVGWSSVLAGFDELAIVLNPTRFIWLSNCHFLRSRRSAAERC